ncbi:uncharacterized protein LOC123513310 [Portunus trituberculatus]|uniref:uncharacterized protein LOC123513310 n=1 Tax=Portunus trituberculatus TaxID=210409 RepID=UPI001E1D2053|nr:uncharacterized protein LOC123513310 [Portunus trituberculatus]
MKMVSRPVVLGLALLHAVVAQGVSQYNPVSQDNFFGLPLGSGSDSVFTSGSNQVGGSPSSGQFGVNFLPGGLNNDNSFSGVSRDVSAGAGGQVLQGFNTLQTFSLPAQTGQSVSSQGPVFVGGPAVLPAPSPPPVFTGQGGAIPLPSQQGPVFIGDQGGVIPLPSQQGPTFIGSQGGSFVGGQVFGQAGPSGVSFQQGGAQAGGFQAVGLGFQSRVIQEEATPTVTRTVTVDAFETLTDLILHSVAVTRTQFSIVTATRATTVIVATPVNHGLSLTTSVIVHPAYVTVTDTKSDFRVVVRTSVSRVTLTHTSYDITHVPFTLRVTETVEVTSPLVRTVIRTSVEAVTNHHTVTNTAYVHGGYQ